MSYPNAASVYRENSVLTAKPEKIVKLLYDGAIRHMERCRVELSNPATCRSATTGESIGKAFAIVSELRTSLDPQAGGEIASNLEKLYDFTLDQLSQANMERTAQPVEHGLKVMRTLKEGWDGIIPTESPAQELLAGIGDRYERALRAIEDDDFERAQQLIDEVDPAMRSLQELSTPSDGESAEFRRATEAYASLMTALGAAYDGARGELSKVRQGQRMLAAYGGRLMGSGIRIERDG